jgi:hypothetical protein
MSEISDRRRNEDRQRALDEVCRRVLAKFIGRPITSTVVAEAEATLRWSLDEAIVAGTYVLPDGLKLDRVELGTDFRIKVFFKKIGVLPMLEPNTSYLLRDMQRVIDQASAVGEAKDEEKLLKNRFEAVAAELDLEG